MKTQNLKWHRLLALIVFIALFVLVNHISYELSHCPQKGDFAFSSEDNFTASNSIYEEIGINNVSRLRIVASIQQDLALRWNVAFDSGATYLASGGEHDSTDPDIFNCGNVWLWNLHQTSSGPRILRSPEGSSIVTNVMFSPSGRVLAASEGGVTGARNIRLWSVISGQELALLEDNATERSLDFSPNGEYLAYGTFHGDVRIWDLEKQREIYLGRHDADISDVKFSPDGSLIASAGKDGAIKLWDVNTLDEVGILRGHTDYVFRLSFNPEGDLLASASFDGTINVWDLENGILKKVFNLPTHNLMFGLTANLLATDLGVVDFETGNYQIRFQQPAWYLDFSPNREVIAAGTKNGIEIWAITSGELLMVLDDHTEIVHDVAFSSNGKLLAAVGSDSDGSILVWAVPVHT
jgi:WD40 repeat protein